MKEATPPTTIEELLAQADWVRGLASALLGESGDADDLVQDTWLAAIRHPPAAGRPARPWIARVMSNLARNRWRGESRRVRRESEAAKPEAQPGGDEVAQELETHRALVEALAGIDEPLRRTIVRRYFHGLSAAEIARSEGVPESTVRTRLQRGLEALRRKLDQKYGDRSAWAALLLPLARRPLLGAAGAGGVLAIWKVAAVLLVCASGWVAWMRMVPHGVHEEIAAGARSPAPRLSISSEAPITSPPPDEPRTPIAPEARTAVASESAATSEDPTFIEGRAIDPAGAPIEGASLVVVDRVGEDLERFEAPCATSGSDGRLRLQVQRSDRYRHRGTSGRAPKNEWSLEITVEAPGRATYHETATLTDGATTPLGDVVLRPGGAVRGRVVVPEGVGVDRKWLVKLIPSSLSLEQQEEARFHSTNETSTAWTRLEEDGSFVFDGVPTGSFRVVTDCRSPGLFESFSAPFDVRVGETLRLPDLVLDRNPNVIEGAVFGPDGSKLRPDWVTYRISGATAREDNYWTSVKQTADSRFAIAFPTPQVCDVYAQSSRNDLGEVIVHDVPTGTRDLRIQIPPAVWMNLRVLDERGQPLASFEYEAVLAVGSGAYMVSGGPRPDGPTRVLVKAEPFLLHVSAPGRCRRDVGPFDLDHHPAEVVVTLPPMPVVRARVTFQNTPIADAEVSLERVIGPGRMHACDGFPSRFDHEAGALRGTTDADGRFSITLRDAGTYALLVSAPGFATAETPPAELTPDREDPEFDIELTAGGRLEGRVIPSPGRSPEGVLVGVSRGDGYCRVERVGSDGRYTFDHLAAGDWSIRRCEDDFAARGIHNQEDVSGFDPGLAHFSIENERTTTFDLDLDGAFCRLEGTLPVGLSRERTWRVSLVPGGTGSDFADPAGAFRVEAHVLGPHDLVFADSGENDRDQRFVAKVDLARGTNEWSSSLATGSLEGDALPGALLEHKWSGPGGATCTTHFLADSRGHFRADRLPSGEGTIAVLRPGNGPVPRAVVVPADDVLHIDLR